ncbi:hypothetical protein OAD81_02950 [Flavobacteriaceae bacterium]|nr:hypothetical protein [Flavobacteriaceae bacterium]
MSKVLKTSMNYEISLGKKYITISKNGEEQSKTPYKKYAKIVLRGVEKKSTKNKLTAFVCSLILLLFGIKRDNTLNNSNWNDPNSQFWDNNYFWTFILGVFSFILLVKLISAKKDFEEQNEMFSKNDAEIQLIYNNKAIIPHFHTVKGTINEIKEIKEEIDKEMLKKGGNNV